MRHLIQSRWTYVATGILGLGFLVSYLVLPGDWRVSLAWAFAFPATSFSVAWLFVGLHLSERFPKLNGYLLYSATGENNSAPLSGDEWALRQAHYLASGFRRTAILSVPAEDGLICVPVLLIGITPFSASLGGVVFGLIHLGRFAYVECIGKGIYYTFVCYFVLPHGLLTVVLGHLILDGLGFVMLQVAKRKLSAELRSNHTVETDARKSSARGSL